ncbi:unnamed protein product, partial [Closterium sp. NIES-53]
DHFLTLDPTSLTVALLEQHLLAAETSAVAVGAARGTPRSPFFDSPSPFPPPLDLLLLQTSLFLRMSVLLRLVRSAKTARARVEGVVEEAAVVVEVAVRAVVGAAVEEVEAVEVEALVAAVEAAEGVAAVEAVGPVVVGLDLSVETLVVVGAGSSSVRARPKRPGSSCVPPDPGIAAAALGASASCTPPGTAPAEALHSFTLDSGASRYFFRDSTTLTPLLAPVSVRVADPSWGPVVASSSTVLPCPADAMVTTTTPGGLRVSICTCTKTGRHLATFTRRPGSSLYTLATEPPQVAASGQVAASCSCRLLSHQTLLLHHRLGHPSLPGIRGMHSRLLVSGLPRSLPPLPPSPAPPCLPCVEGRQRAAPHSSSFPPTTAPLQTLHMDVWGPARVSGQGRECYFVLVVDDYTRYTTVFPLRSKGEVYALLIPWIRTVRLQLRERFGQDLPVLRLHIDRGGEFSSDLLRDFCHGEGITLSFTLPDSPQQNEIAERRIGLVMEVARTSMIHAAAPHFLWPLAVRYAAKQLNLWPHVSLLETSPTLRWTGTVGDASVFRVWGSRAFVRETSMDKLSARVIPCVFLGFVPDAPSWKFYHPTSRRVLPSQDVTFDESGLAPLGVSQVDPLPGPAPVQVAVVLGVARGTASEGAASGGAASGGVEPGGAGSEGAGSGGAEPKGAKSEGADPEGAELEVAEFGGAEPRAGEPGDAGAGGAAVTTGAGDPTEPGVAGAGAGVAEVGGPGAGCAGGAGAGAVDPGAGGAGGTVRPRSYFVPLLQQSQPPLQPASPLPVPSPYTELSGGLTEHREPASRPVSPVRTTRRAPRSRPPPVPGTHTMALRPSSVPLRVPLPAPPDSSLPEVLDPESDRARASSPIVARLLAAAVTNPSFESTAASALVAELLSFAAACRLDYASALVAESVPPSPPSVGEAIMVPYSSQWQLAMDAEMASWKSTGTYVDEVSPPGVNIVDGMWIFSVKRPPVSPPAFKARYVARGSPPGTSRVARHTQDYTCGSWVSSFYSRPVVVSTHRDLSADVLVYVDDLIFSKADTEALTVVKARRTITLTQSHMVHQVLQRFGFQYSSPLLTPLSTSHSLSASPSDESAEPSGPYPELVGCLMYLMTCTRPDLAYPLSLLSRYVAPVRRAWGLCSEDRVHLGSGSVSWRSNHSSSVLSSSCEAEIYAGAMAARELRWLTYLLTDLEEQRSSPPVLYVDNKAMIALCQEHRLEHRTKHIALRYFLARELQQCGQLRLAYVATRANTADVFTKALPPSDHQRFSSVLGLVPTLPHLLTA